MQRRHDKRRWVLRRQRALLVARYVLIVPLKEHFRNGGRDVTSVPDRMSHTWYRHAAVAFCSRHLDRYLFSTRYCYSLQHRSWLCHGSYFALEKPHRWRASKLRKWGLRIRTSVSIIPILPTSPQLRIVSLLTSSRHSSWTHSAECSASEERGCSSRETVCREIQESQW